jgi:hypothetical protein
VGLIDLVMTLVFLASVLVVVVLVVRLVVLTLLSRWGRLRGTAVALGSYLAAYLLVLVTVGLAMPRLSFAPGERRCFDDWCVAGVAVAADTAPTCAARGGERAWVATLEVSSDAKRVRQRARDARAVLEDRAGHRYRPCAAPVGRHELADELGPGESFSVAEPFLLPAGAVPAGLVVYHGEIPGVLIIADDQSLLHAPALLEARVSGP